MPRGRRHAFLAVLVALSTGHARAEAVDPCDESATVSPCFDADPLWLPTGATHFSTLGSPRPLTQGASTLLLAGGFSYRPVLLAVPSPEPEGREIHVVNATSTLTLGLGFGLPHALGVTFELPFVPYQEGAGAEAVTSQQAPPLGTAAVRDPRVGIGWTALGVDPSEAFSLGTRLEVTLPAGNAALFAGSPGPTLAPAVTAELDAGRFVAGADLGLRLRKAVDFGTVRKGSEAVLGLGVAFEALASPLLSFGLEAWLRPGLAGRPDGVEASELDLPAEWLVQTTYAWDPKGPFSLTLGGGSGLPLSSSPGPNGETAHFSGVTAPAFRALLALRVTPRPP